jgi:hypothetical protein
MLQEHAQCSHVSRLEAIMTACDASIFVNVPVDILKIPARIVKKWSSYGLPYATEISCASLFNSLLFTYNRDLVQEEDDGIGEAPAAMADSGSDRQAPQETANTAQDVAEGQEEGDLTKGVNVACEL